MAEAAHGSADIAGNTASVTQASADAAQVWDHMGASMGEESELSEGLRAEVGFFT